MSKILKWIGKTVTHNSLGKVQVLCAVKNSRTRVEIRCIQRAKGWDEYSESYKPFSKFLPNLDVNGVEIGKTFTRTINSENNDEYGHLDECHINELEI